MTDLPPPPPPNMGPPPGYVAYGGSGAVQGQPQRTGGLVKWLVPLLALSIVAQAVSLLVQLTLKSAATDFVNDTITGSELDDKLVLYGLIVVLISIASIAQLVVLIIWTFRLAKNHQVLGRQPQTFKPGATIAVNILGGCTLGILNFFMWRELWLASEPDVAPGDSRWKQGAISPLLYVYLASTLIGVASSVSVGFSGGFSVGTGTNTNDFAERLDDKLGLVLLSGGFGLVAAISFLLFVRQLSARHMQATREA